MRTCSTSETCGVAGAGAMGMADAAGDAAKAPNKDAATRPILRFMMCLPPLTQYRISKFVSDQIVAEPKCNADEQVFSQSTAGQTVSSAKAIRASSPLNVGLASAPPRPRQAAGLRNREAIAAVERRQIAAPAEHLPGPLRSRDAGGDPGRHRRPRCGSNGWSTGRRKRRRYRG
jgi:hypothetical protein